MVCNSLISNLNAQTVEESYALVKALPAQELNCIMAAFASNPDSRFGDNLLVALSIARYPNLANPPIEEIDCSNDSYWLQEDSESDDVF
jgi:hypothetical protein